jgi:hypothetical protein
MTRGSSNSTSALALASVLSIAACRDDAGDPSAEDPTPGDETGGNETGGDDGMVPEDPPPQSDIVGRTGLRRLSVFEYDNAVADLLGDDTRPARTYLPEDVRTPFDNDVLAQVPSSALVDGAEALALDVARRLTADPARRVGLVGCEPTGPEDLACLRPFVQRVGRIALRRPLTAEEVDRLLELRAIGVQAGDGWITVETIVAALLQHPEFLYRVELGSPRADDPAVFQLGPYEMASRLSFFLWGTIPDEALLDRAAEIDAEGRTFLAEERRALAEQMLADARARDQVERFHALWLNFEVLPHEPALSEPMKAESRALIDRVVFEDRSPWSQLWLSDETWVSASLAEHYGLPAPSDASGGWVSYGDSSRAGLLSQGSFLANGGAFGDTSPIMRGIVVKTRLLCGEIPPPPDNVNADDEPMGESPCKWDRYAPHRQPECAGCHNEVDPYGWGLEAYDAQGKFRSLDDAGCELSEHTQVDVPQGTFDGPGQLGALVADSDELRHCVTTQLYRFALGRGELGGEDEAFVDALSNETSTDFALDELLLDFVANDAFGHRKEEEPS